LPNTLPHSPSHTLPTIAADAEATIADTIAAGADSWAPPSARWAAAFAGIVANVKEPAGIIAADIAA
jgi:hypothetical protein